MSVPPRGYTIANCFSINTILRAQHKAAKHFATPSAFAKPWHFRKAKPLERTTGACYCFKGNLLYI